MKVIEAPKNVDELYHQLAESFAQLRDDPRRIHQVKELANVAGKMIGIVKAKLCYAALRGQEPDIPYLGKTSGKPLPANAKLLTS
ncbi:MAG TPA: hypothetical protein VFA85_12755 [Terriglobales bacterium]|nr:hypothetical protein [Terriglobales bacterium]